MKRKHMILLAVVLVLAVLFFYRTNPLRHTQMFVSMYSDQIERNIHAGEGVPDNLGCLDVYMWEGDHLTAEFILSRWGIGSDTRYYGCYYSSEDVPMAFQSADVSLTQEDSDTWVWIGEGDNYGSTQKLKDNWYYFEASF